MKLSHTVFPARLKAARDEAKLSQSELARRAEMRPEQVCRLEAGKVSNDKGVTLERFVRLANILKVSADSLLR